MFLPQQRNPHKGEEGMKLREQTTIRLPAELKERVQQEAERLGISFNELVMLAINKFIQNYQI